MKDVMIDFETFGNGDRKCICQIGAVYFDRVTGELGSSYKANIDAKSHVKLGAVIDADTVYWWLQQSEAARMSVTAPGQDIIEVLTGLNEFLSNAKRVWSHATFDFVTLMSCFKQAGIIPKVSYKSGMDLRTLVYLAGTRTDDEVRDGTHHDGLEDAKYQVKYAVKALNQIKMNKRMLSFIDKVNNE